MAKGRTTTQELAVPDDLILGLANRAEQEAAALQGSARVSFPSLRVVEVRKDKTSTATFVEVVNPAVRDEQNNPKVTRFDSVRVNILAHVPIRRLRYNGLDPNSKKPRLVTELFSVGPKKGALAIGTAVGGVVTWDELMARYPDGFDRVHIPYGSDQVTRGKVKVESRYYVVVGLADADVREAAGSDIAFMGLSMSSTYGIQVKDPDEFEDLDMTLLAYPNSADPEKHKGVLHRLASRPWQLGLAAGLPEDKAAKTPQHAIWLKLFGTRIGDTATAVHGFEIDEELTREELVWAKEAEGNAIGLLRAIIEQEVRDAYPAFNATHLPKLGAAVTAQDWNTVNQTLRLAAPLAAEIVEDEAIAEGEDLDAPAHGPVATEVEDEFPPEESLPFD